eukprot:scaffold8993_cov207-Skeletonema_marinoi.AAC.32
MLSCPIRHSSKKGTHRAYYIRVRTGAALVLESMACGIMILDAHSPHCTYRYVGFGDSGRGSLHHLPLRFWEELMKEMLVDDIL